MELGFGVYVSSQVYENGIIVGQNRQRCFGGQQGK